MYKFSEYEYVSNYYFDKLDSEIFPFVLFAFFRSKKDDSVALERLHIYIDALVGNDFESVLSSGAYKSFNERFMSGVGCVVCG